MSQPQNEAARRFPVKSAAVTDRGLNQKRPLNEDSFLADSARGIFAVADGVGGAEAGEVASQTAVEVLDEAFRHHLDGADIEDLMELAIQRANASIHQMSQEHNKFSMMATTIVALYLEGNTATIGHVGDSRLYRLTPAGQLVRETADHSVVEEEVRAGRMTAEQAANHPSKNVISRALGAESDVEVDLKVIEIEDGTQFLLCTDGITRHIPDHEIRQLLIVEDDLPSLCEELKQRCFERGAEDNLTAVLVRVGNRISADQRREDLEKTISPETTATPEATSEREAPAVFVPASRTAFPGPTEAVSQSPMPAAQPARLNPVTNVKSSSTGLGKTLARLFVLLLFVGAIAGAFYAGRQYRGPIPYIEGSQTPEPSPSPAAVVSEGDDAQLLKFERARMTVDKEPNEWLANGLKQEMARQNIPSPLNSTEPEFLYLYGRASLLSGNTDEAGKAFAAAISAADLNATPLNATLKREATLGLAAVALKSEAARPEAQRHLEEVVRTPPLTPTPAVSP